MARLQLLDSLSLYACLNEPGTPKEKEHPWYRNGFSASDKLLEQRLTASWDGPQSVILSADVLEQPFTAALRVKRIPRHLAAELGIDAAWRQTPWSVEETRWKPSM